MSSQLVSIPKITKLPSSSTEDGFLIRGFGDFELGIDRDEDEKLGEQLSGNREEEEEEIIGLEWR